MVAAKPMNKILVVNWYELLLQMTFYSSASKEEMTSSRHALSISSRASLQAISGVFALTAG